MSYQSEHRYQCKKCNGTFTSLKRLAKHYREQSCTLNGSLHESSPGDILITINTGMGTPIVNKLRNSAQNNEAHHSYHVQSTSDNFNRILSPNEQSSKTQKLALFQNNDSSQWPDAFEDAHSHIFANDKKLQQKKQSRDNHSQITSFEISKKKQTNNFSEERSLVINQKHQKKQRKNSFERYDIQGENNFRSDSPVNSDEDEDIQIVYETSELYGGKPNLAKLTLENLFCPQCQQKFTDKYALHRHFAWHLNNDLRTENKPEAFHTETNSDFPGRVTETENRSCDSLIIRRLAESPEFIQNVDVRWILEGNDEEYRIGLMIQKLIVDQWMTSAV